jgi:hypothetical protein
MSTRTRIRDGREAPRPVVFYDGGYPLCSHEIAHYRRRHGSENRLWVDVGQDYPLLHDYGSSQSAAMERFHVLNKDGRSTDRGLGIRRTPGTPPGL